MKRLALFCSQFIALFSFQAFAQNDVAEHNWSMLESYCTDCHNNEDWAGSVAFDLMSPEGIAQDAETWESAVRKLRGRLMPPPGSDQPQQAQIDEFLTWMEGSLDSANDAAQVGYVPLHRLNRPEYALAVKELLAVDIDPVEYLPADIEVDGFDNIAAALSISPSFLEQYISLARVVAHLAVGEQVPKLANTYYPAPGGAQESYVEGMPFGTRGGMLVKHHFPADGEYRINILDLDVGLYPRSLETVQTLVVLVGGEEVFRGNIGGEEDLATVNKGGAPGRAILMERFANIPALVSAGDHEVVVTFVERSRVETDEPIGGFVAYGGFSFEGSLRVPRLLDGIEVGGPFTSTGVSQTPSREKLFVCQAKSPTEELPCAKKIIENLARKAFRRPLKESEVDIYLPFFEEGRNEKGEFDEGVERAIAAVLVSPDFLYRGISPNKDIDESQVFALSDRELATRLSFFLWSQGPDEELLSLADSGELTRPSVMNAQVSRMLVDSRANSLIDGFALKWLDLDNLDGVVPDPNLYREFSAELQADFSEELRLFLSSVLLDDRPLIELLNAEHSFLNERLARHYDISTVHGGQFRRVELANDRRWGLLGKGAVLMRTSYGDRTSPVLRGAWVLDKILGTPPTPPPPNVETDLSVPEGGQPTTVRARLEQHRAQPSCNQCHGVIDPIGLALENFTVTGQWRDRDELAGESIDARTVLPNGLAINGVTELRQELSKNPEQFALAMTEKLMMYSLGRELEYFDMPQVRAIVHEAQTQEYRLSSLVQGIVNSSAFRMQALPESDDGNDSEVQIGSL